MDYSYALEVATIIYPVSVDPYSIQVRHPRVCKDEAHWLVVKLVIPGPMSFVLTYSGILYLDTVGVHANWIDYSGYVFSGAPTTSTRNHGIGNKVTKYQGQT